MTRVRKRIRVGGRVQGVGFRYFTSSIGRNLGLVGQVRNEPEGTVLIEVEGDPVAVEQFLVHVRQGPALARVATCEIEDLPPGSGLSAFEIDR